MDKYIEEKKTILENKHISMIIDLLSLTIIAHSNHGLWCKWIKPDLTLISF